jgi:broad specificity phosphatase PhoE
VTALVLVRHAATAWSGQRYSGRGDPPLSAEGRLAAETLWSRLVSNLPPGIRIVTSPSRRAYDTAALLAVRVAPVALEIDERWMEADVGDVEGLTFDEVAVRYPDLATRLARGDVEIDWPGGETADALHDRVVAAFAAILAADRPTVVVSHAGPIRIAVALGTGQATVEVPLPGPAEAVTLEVGSADRPISYRARLHDGHHADR